MKSCLKKLKPGDKIMFRNLEAVYEFVSLSTHLGYPTVKVTRKFGIAYDLASSISKIIKTKRYEI